MVHQRVNIDRPPIARITRRGRGFHSIEIDNTKKGDDPVLRNDSMKKMRIWGPSNGCNTETIPWFIQRKPLHLVSPSLFTLENGRDNSTR